MHNKFLLAAVIWVMFITYACLTTPANIPKASWLTIEHLDKIVHFIFYFVFTLLLSNAYRVKVHTVKKAWLYAFATAVVYGILIELCQGLFTNARSADVVDAFANTSGSAFAVFVLWLFQKKK